MAKYVNFKLKTGEDLVGVVVESTPESITVNHPIQILVHPQHGYFAKSWMMLSDDNEVQINKSDTLWVTNANDRAIEYYDEFLLELANREPQTVEELNDEVEDMWSTLVESNISTKH